MNTPRTKIPDDLREKQLETGEENIVDRPLSEERMLSYVRRYFVGLGVVIFTMVVTVFFWNLLAPEKCRWLSQIEMDRISNLAVSIIVGLLISAMATYFFSKRR